MIPDKAGLRRRLCSIGPRVEIPLNENDLSWDVDHRRQPAREKFLAFHASTAAGGAILRGLEISKSLDGVPPNAQILQSTAVSPHDE